MAETCKECENSKYKEGALFCGSYNTYPSNIDVAAKDCSHFTPKKPPSETYAERQEAWVKKHGIKVENRPYDEPEDKWREGLYIYKDNEIVGFISHPQKLGGGLIHLFAPQFVVRTNIDPDRG